MRLERGHREVMSGYYSPVRGEVTDLLENPRIFQARCAFQALRFA